MTEWLVNAASLDLPWWITSWLVWLILPLQLMALAVYVASASSLAAVPTVVSVQENKIARSEAVTSPIVGRRPTLSSDPCPGVTGTQCGPVMLVNVRTCVHRTME